MMDISALSNTYLVQETARLNRQLGKTASFQTALENAAAAGDDKELLSACKEFESYFIQMMLKEMRKTIDTSASLIPKSNAENIFQDMLDEQYASAAAKNGRGIGLAEMMYKQMKRNTVAQADETA